MDIKSIFGKNLQKYRKKAGLSQEEFAEKTDTSFQHISNIENGRNFVSSDLLEAIINVLKISPAALFIDDSFNDFSEDDISYIRNSISDSLKKAESEIIEKIISKKTNLQP